jgi:PAS domain S-box-containing protein
MDNTVSQITYFYKTIIQNAPDGIVIIDRKLRIRFVSDSALKILDYQRCEIENTEATSILHPDDIPLIRSAILGVLRSQDKMVTIEYRAKHKDGTWRWIESNYTYMFRDPVIKGIVVNLRDITDKKAAFDKLRENQLVLDKLLGESAHFIESESSTAPDFLDIAEFIREITGAKYVAVNIIDPKDDGYYTKALSGVSETVLLSMRFLGFNLMDYKWKHPKNRMNLSLQNTIIRYENLREVVGKAIPKAVIRAVENHFLLGEIVVVSIIRERKLLGDFILLFKNGNSLKNGHFAELYAHMVGQYLMRKRIEEMLMFRMNEMERFQKLTVDREIMMIELKNEVNHLLKLSGNKPKYNIVK